ncbi:probable glucan endo-1,3-beta-glucosidase BG4 [Neltuma alba]|uniref:probable glucan endo-1,3-beta-glucosidase BG4 n=1 Tax=Neltuma alba TaxID=207710 RepID=UPI0010A4C3BE|nr:probable glucan endo-1,3-beta-glucosidase BG4 [Prosopis alba]
MMRLVQIAIALCALAATAEAVAPIGVNYGRLGDNLPPPAEVVQMFQQNGITKMRLFDPDVNVLNALRNSKIGVALGVRNQDLQLMSTNMDAVKGWFAANIEPFLNDVAFEFIVVGNELVPGELANFILPVMQNFQAVLDGRKLDNISVTTCVATSVFGNSYPPSASVFADNSREVMIKILGFLAYTQNPLLINLYPYFAYASDPVNVRLDYAQFTAPGVVVQDGPLGYQNMLDAMIDAFFWAMEKVGVNNVGLVVSETGWPSAGNGNFTSPTLASTYNKNFAKRITTKNGTPKKPDAVIPGFIFAMFNENQKPAGVEQNFGLFLPTTKQPVYPVFPL